MKLSKFAIAGILGLALAASASAQNTIRIIGATTFRAPVHAAIEAILSPGYAFADSGSDNSATQLGKASAAEFVGTLLSGSGQGDTVVIKTYWTGSVAGVSDVASQRHITGFMADGLAVAGGTGLGGSYAQEPTAEPADMSMSDAPESDDALCLQLGNAAAKSAKSTMQGTTLTEAGFGQSSQGIVPFEWILENIGTNPAPISNITQAAAMALIKKGNLPVMTLTGTTANQYDFLFLIGRNEDSGSRCNAFAEAQTGFGQTAIQYMPSYVGTSASYQDIGATASYISSTGTNYVYDGGTSATLSGLQEWPSGWAINTNTAIAWTNPGHSGFVSGGEVASALEAVDPVTSGSISITSGAPTTVHNVYVVGYVGTSDAQTAITGGAVDLQYNGVTYSQNAVKTGQYTFWGYEHSLYNSSLESGDSLYVINDIANEVYSTTASYASNLQPATDRTAAGIVIAPGSGVLVTRTGPGQPVYNNY
jgi:hypothetical protein